MAGATQIRPKCKLETDISADSIKSEVTHMLEKSDSIVGKIRDNYIYLSIPESDQHYWSPEMRINIKENEDGSTIVNGVVGPNGKVWGTFLVFYGLAVMLFIFGGSLGISEIMLDKDSLWIWSIPSSAILYGIIVVAAKYGQRLGHDQHLRLRYFLDEAINNAENRKQVITDLPSLQSS